MVEMLRGGTRHTNIWNSFSRGLISRGPHLGELLPSYSLLPKRGTSQTGAGTSLVPMPRYSKGLAAGQFFSLSIILDFEKEDRIRIVDMGQKDRCVSWVWEPGMVGAFWPRRG